MAKSIDAMANVDAVYFAEGWAKARGCRLERMVCQNYGVKILDSDFLFEKEKPTFKDAIRSMEAVAMDCKNLVLGKHDENGDFRRRDLNTYYSGGELSEFIDK